jgi:aryl-alcohol dehydrogenase-like predicted oxidoreductase
MPTSLGATGPQVFPVVLGCMGMSGVYGATSDDASVALIGNAIDRGITMIDTGDFYAHGHNEMLVGRAIAGRRDKVQLSVKFGMMRGPDGGSGGADCRPAAAFAADHHRMPGELLIAWALAKQPTLVPVIGARTPAQLDAIFAAASRPLTEAEVAAIEALVPRDAIAGDRYPAAHMAQLDSEN